MRVLVALIAVLFLGFAKADHHGIPVKLVESATGPNSASERRETYYPGQCPDDSGWYLVESDQTHVVIGCYDPDYTPPQDPDNQ